jgi:hypothetical protein
MREFSECKYSTQNIHFGESLHSPKWPFQKYARLTRLADICQAVWGVLARLDDICQKTILRKMVPKQHFFQGLANLVNLASLASNKCPKIGKCWDSPD